MWRTLFLGVPAIVSGSSPTLDSDGVLHTVFNNSLYAISGDDGSTKWILQGNSSSAFDSHAEFNLNNNTIDVPVVIATLKGTSTEPDALLALDSLDGSIKWKRQMDQGIYINGHPIVIWPGIIYLTSGAMHCINGTTIDAIDPATGEIKWSYNTAGCGSVLNTAYGFVYVMSGSSLDALHDGNGTVQWSVELGDKAGDRFDVLTRMDDVFVVERNHTHMSVMKVSNHDGSILWNKPFPLWKDDVRTNPWTILGNGGQLYVNGINLADWECGLAVFNYAGDVLRMLPCLPDSPFYSNQEDLFVTVAETGDLQFAGSNVSAHSGTDGHLLWNVSTPRLSRGVHFGWDGTVFVWDAGANADASAYAIKKGNVAWSVQTGGAMDQIMSEDGTTYVQGFRLEGTEPKLEVVAVGTDGAEKWRYTPPEVAVVVV